MYSVIAKHDRKEVQKRTWRPINGPNGSGMYQEPCQISIDGKSVYCPYITTDKHIRYFIFDGSFLTPARPSVDCSACRWWSIVPNIFFFSYQSFVCIPHAFIWCTEIVCPGLTLSLTKQVFNFFFIKRPHGHKNHKYRNVRETTDDMTNKNSI